MLSVVEALRKCDNYLITAHVNPEGDSIGSQLAACNILRQMGKKAVIMDHDDVPENMRFLSGTDKIRAEVPADFAPETFLVLDCPVKERTGTVARFADNAQCVINIDHHISNEYFGDVNWVEPTISSVGEMLYNVARELGVPIDKDLAEAIYAAMVTDTGMFNYDNTSSDTHRVVGELIDAGVNPKYMHGKIFEHKSRHEVRLLGKALSTLYVSDDGKLSSIELTRKMYSDEGVERIPTDEFINFPRSVKGVEVALFFKESPQHPGLVYVSFRSTGGVDVNKIASVFGGGGHPKASGCMIKDTTLEDAKERVIAEAEKAIRG